MSSDIEQDRRFLLRDNNRLYRLIEAQAMTRAYKDAADLIGGWLAVPLYASSDEWARLAALIAGDNAA